MVFSLARRVEQLERHTCRDKLADELTEVIDTLKRQNARIGRLNEHQPLMRIVSPQ